MRCHEARGMCGPYLDSELDVKSSFEVEQHLEHCPDCARYFAAEKQAEERLSAALRAGEKTDALWQQVAAQISAPRARNGGLSRKRLALTALAAIAAIAFLWLREPKLDLAVAVARDHAEFVAGDLKPQFALQPPAEIMDQAGGRLDAAAFDKLPVTQEFRVEGKRLCHLSGVPVAWALARMGDQPVSVIVLRWEEVGRFPQFRQRLESGHPVVCSRAGRFQFAARIVGDHVVCAVAEMSRARLEDLVRSVPSPG
ncbi:MAG: anti-sigma factor [Verrucomicrobiota bacterium]